MIKNYLKIALRQLWKNKLFSALNIFGLAVSIAVCLLLILVLADQYGYDEFHEGKEKIYRIITDKKEVGTYPKRPTYATTALSVAERLIYDFTFVDAATRIVELYGKFKVGNQRFKDFESGLAVDQSFLDVFTFNWVAGDQRTALMEPRSIVLTESTAKSMFPYSDPIGATVEYDELGQYIVTGIISNPPARTQIQFDYLISFSTITDAFTQEDREKINVYNYDEIWRGHVFLKLKQKNHIKELDQALTQLSASYSEKDPNHNFLFGSQRITDITPTTVTLSNELHSATPIIVLRFLIALGIIIILAACFNYMNLSIARSLKRAREIGVRKVIGAGKKDLVIQFIGEAVVIALFAFAIALVMLEFLIPAFYSLDPFVGEVFHMEKTPGLYLLFLGFSLIVGMLAGLFPAFNIASFPPIESLQQLRNVRLFKRIGFRKLLITIQFTLSLIFILTVLIVLKQQHYILNKDLGVRVQNMYNVYLDTSQYEVFAQEVRKLKGVEQVSGSNYGLLAGERSSTMVKYNNQSDSMKLASIIGTSNFIDNMGIELVAGDRIRGNNAATEQFILINETASDRMGYSNPEQAIGQAITLDTTSLIIAGVLKDFHHNNIWFEPIKPFAIRQIGDYDYRNASISLYDRDLKSTVADIKSIYSSLFPENDMNSFFVDTRIYNMSKFFRMGSSIIGFVGFLTIVISCLGLLGMVIYTVEGKVKEVGIRKVLGAGEGNIVWNLSKGFMILLFISILLALPVVYFGSRLWLQNFVLQTHIGPSIYLIGIGAILLIGLITVISQTYLAAKQNPVESLRQE